MKKIRLDVYLAQSALSQTREKAKREILAGWVKVNGETISNPASTITGSEQISVERPGGLYVSRGGRKLKHALDVFGIVLTGRVAADLGASTGGFTDCMLKEGAVKVYAIDVGYGQLDYSLRKDSRVVVMEKKNVRNLLRNDFSDKVDFVSVDLSFISIIKAFDAIRDVFSPIEGVILIKPQFESGPGQNKKGVVRKPEDHIEILSRVISAIVEKGSAMKGLAYSPIKGPKGNIEFLLYFECNGILGRPTVDKAELESIISEVVEKAHNYQ